MCKRISLFSILAVLLHTTVPVVAGIPEQLEQAERLCATGRLADAEQVYRSLVEQANTADQKNKMQRKLAALLAVQGKLSSARDVVETVLAGHAEHERLPHAIHEIAETCNKYGMALKAAQIYQEILHDQPDRTDAIWLVMGQAIGQAYSGTRDPSWGARDKLLFGYTNDSRTAEAVAQLAWCYRKMGKLEDARVLYRYVIDTWPRGERVIFTMRGLILADISLEDWAAAKVDIAEMLQKYSQDPRFAQSLGKVAEAYRKKERFVDSRDLHQSIVDNYADSEQAIWSLRGVILSNIGLGDDSAVDNGIQDLLSGFAEHPNLPGTLYQIARKLNDRNSAQAQQLYELIVGAHGDDEHAVLAMANLGGLKVRQQDQTAARKIFDQTLTQYKDRPILPKAVALMAEAYYEQAIRKDLPMSFRKEHYRKALSEWERVIEQFDEVPYTTAMAHYFAGVCHRRLGEYDEAIEYFSAVTEKWPDFVYAWSAQCLTGSCYEKLRDSQAILYDRGTDLMEEAYRRVIERYPDCSEVPVASMKLGELCLRRGERNEAIEYFKLFMEKAHPSDSRRRKVEAHLKRLGG
mgnify:CR=1 FL=1